MQLQKLIQFPSNQCLLYILYFADKIKCGIKNANVNPEIIYSREMAFGINFDIGVIEFDQIKVFALILKATKISDKSYLKTYK